MLKEGFSVPSVFPLGKGLYMYVDDPKSLYSSLESLFGCFRPTTMQQAHIVLAVEEPGAHIVETSAMLQHTALGDGQCRAVHVGHVRGDAAASVVCKACLPASEGMQRGTLRALLLAVDATGRLVVRQETASVRRSALLKRYGECCSIAVLCSVATPPPPNALRGRVRRGTSPGPEPLD